MTGNSEGRFAVIRRAEAANAPDAYCHERGGLLELLSERLLRDFPVAAWRDAFLDPGPGGIRFEEGQRTFVCTSPLGADWSTDELEALARRYCGHFERLGELPAFALCDARSALDLAFLLHRLTGRRLRVALLTLQCTVATVQVGGRAMRLTVTPGLDEAQSLVDSAAPGSIVLGPEAHKALASYLQRHAGPSLVRTECTGGSATLAEASFSPPTNARTITFAVRDPA